MMDENGREILPDRRPPDEVVVRPRRRIVENVRREVYPDDPRVDVYSDPSVDRTDVYVDRGAPRRNEVYVDPATPRRTDVYVDPTPPLRVRESAIIRRRYTVGKIIDFLWYILGVLEVALALRFFFQLMGADRAAGFVRFLYAVTLPFVWPFSGIFSVPRDGNFVFDPNIIVAMLVYALIFWGLTRLIAMTIEPPSIS